MPAVTSRSALTFAVGASLLALFISLGGIGYAANGAALLLGKSNGATAQTRLVAKFDGTALRIDNPSTGADATALTLATEATRPPMIVTSQKKVTNLNADLLDGLNSTQFTRRVAFPFDLAAGASTIPISADATTPFRVTGATTTDGDRSVGEATVIRNGSTSLSWVGLNACCTIDDPHAAARGNSGATGAIIAIIDANAEVGIEVVNSDEIRVRNGAASRRTGILVFEF